jgi:TonB family protein
MGYRALLFCPDEKTAQTVTLVLNDLEFTVEACSEPFAAVKKLMGEHFDGVVVDCDNEQNATLLFKSARQSASNQAALAVAIVEGQAGVAKAFRIGANLVLTKPINVEQAKGTLRVARGLLRKGESVKPPAHTENATVTAPRATPPSRSSSNLAAGASSHAASSIPAASRKAEIPAAKASPWGNRVSDSLVPATNSSAHDQSASEHTSEELPIGPESSPPTTTAPSGTAPAPSAAFSAMQQIARKTSGPSNSGSSDRSSLSHGSSSHGSSSHISSSSGSSPLGIGLASATARVPQGAKTAEPLLSKIARTVGTMDELAEASDSDTSFTATAKPVVGVTLEADHNQPSTENYLQSTPQAKSETKSQPRPGMAGSKKVLLAVVALVLLAVAFYFVRTQLHGRVNLGSAISYPSAKVTGTSLPQPPTKSAQATLLSPPPASPSPVSSAAQTMQKADQAASRAGSDANDTAAETTDGVPTADNSNKSSASDSSSAAKSGTRPLIVKNGNKTTTPKRTTTDASAPDVIVSAQDSAGALPNLIDVSTKSAPVLQTLAISQGVSQGLIVKKVQPNYPSSALRLQLEGAVRLLATVGKKGNITSVKTLSGEPLLAQAAADAVKQWKYKPYLLNGEPVEIQTQVTINFKLPR